MSDIVMPKLSDTMTEGRLVSWKKRVGEKVNRGDVLAEVETDKANMELEAFTSGVLLEIKVEAGEMAEVGTVIAVIGEAGEKGAEAKPAAPEAKSAQPEEKPAQPEEKPAATAAPEAKEAPEGTNETELKQPEAAKEPEAETKAEGKTEPEAEKEPEGKTEPEAEQEPEAKEAPKAQEAEPAKKAAGEEEAERESGAAAGESREKAAPVVRRRARELGVDLSQIQGSGPDGRILMEDLEGAGGAAGAGKAAAEPGTKPAAPPPLQEGTKPIPRLRAAVAKIVSQSWSSIPHFTVTMDILMDEAESIHRQMKQAGQPVTVNDMIVRAVSIALQKFPQLNASFAEDGMRLHADVNVGVAVGVRDGVLIPVIAGCQKLSLQEISRESHKLAERARSGALSEQEMSGGTFSVSNLGMYGVSQFTAVIFPSQSAVLAVGAVADAVVVRSGAPACVKLMKVTLCADHRLVDGAYAAEFLVELKSILENPLRLLI